MLFQQLNFASEVYPYLGFFKPLWVLLSYFLGYDQIKKDNFRLIKSVNICFCQFCIMYCLVYLVIVVVYGLECF